MTDVIPMIERMAESGTAPRDGCSLFGVGYEDAFERLKHVYLERRFERGGAAEKFVVGPFGSGKTHFLRQLMEVAREAGCITADVSLNKDVDFTKSLIVYQELVRELRLPGASATGLRSLLLGIVDKLRSSAPAPAGDALCEAWISGLKSADFELESFGRAAYRAFKAHLQGDEGLFEACLRWLGGEVTDRALAHKADLPVVTKAEENLHARRATLSLYQLVRHARFRGTVVAFDEGEQGLTVDKRKTQRILSMLQSGINAMADLERGSALVVYAFTPDLIEKMDGYAALQQRVSDPSEGQGFFDGNTLAAKIDLARRADPVQDLQEIGRKLVRVLYQQLGGTPAQGILVAESAVVARIDRLAREVAEREAASSNRRTMVKRTCSLLIRLHDEGVLDEGPTRAPEARETEV